MNKNIIKLWESLENKLDYAQKGELCYFLYDKANELLHHHNLISMHKANLSEKQIYRERKIALMLKERLKRKGLVVDFVHKISYTMGKNKKAQWEICIFLSNGTILESKFPRNISVEFYDELLLRLKNKKLNKFIPTAFHELYFTVLHAWEIDISSAKDQIEQLQEKYDFFYSEAGRKQWIDDKNIRKRRYKDRVRYIESLNYHKMIFSKSHEFERIAAIKEINLAKKFKKNYIKYGIMQGRFNIEVIDILVYYKKIFLNDPAPTQHVLIIWRNGEVNKIVGDVSIIATGSFIQRHPPDYSFKDTSEENLKRLNDILIEAYRMNIKEVEQYYINIWGDWI